MTEFNEPLLSWVLLVARCCLAAIFIVSGIHKGAWYPKAVEEWRQVGVPGFTLPLTILLHIAGSLALISGLYAREVAIVLAVFVLMATILVHNFWAMKGVEKLIHSRAALANLGVIGGLMLLAAVGPGNLIL